jgi:hypothetical protein
MSATGSDLLGSLGMIEPAAPDGRRRLSIVSLSDVQSASKGVHKIIHCIENDSED